MPGTVFPSYRMSQSLARTAPRPVTDAVTTVFVTLMRESSVRSVCNPVIARCNRTSLASNDPPVTTGLNRNPPKNSSAFTLTPVPAGSGLP